MIGSHEGVVNPAKKFLDLAMLLNVYALDNYSVIMRYVSNILLGRNW